MKFTKITLSIFSIIFIASCATYYQKNLKFQEHVTNGKLEKAKQLLLKDTKSKENRNKLLYYFNLGWINFMLQESNESNSNFAQADIIIEDQQKKYGLEALSLVSNPGIKPYKPEDFEVVLLNYYKTLNYLRLQKFEEALVECKKINIKLNSLNDKHKDHKNRYQQDAFAHLIMGLVYDAGKDYNNAFIAYRNALEIYETDYSKNFGIEAPLQLKKDILRTASLVGFYDEVQYYEKQFGIKYMKKENRGGELIFLWQNGFGPVKSEWSINFSKVDGEGGWITLVNDDLGINFPFYIGDKSAKEKSAFADLSFLRIAFPKYLERPTYFNGAEIIANQANYPLEIAEDINEIAFKTLHDRMLREIGTSILRLATKKALELAARKENENIGAAIGIVNALTEKADTRNWQTLPRTISYARIPLPEGKNTIELKTYGNRKFETKQLSFDIEKKRSKFFVFHSIESFPPVEN
ncbi:MAG: hypothetical protein HN704_16135 [Bacteroidetes bacterium]|jgi:uncharacterized protein|nr:hypothetical protein [Bacteroidota bacterium]MBT7141969.1 hypothetical protein [Bacteroidota bacterium]MBT7493127.1 hypothetical protein [Bacteroidota bacterium]